MRYQLDVHVNPGTSHRKATWRHDHLKVNLKSPPEDGKANEELLEYLRKLFELQPDDLTLKHGEKGQKKTITLRNLDRETLVRRMDSLRE